MSVSWREVTPIVVTRGDADLQEIVDDLEHQFAGQPVVWDNSRATVDLRVLGRWWAAQCAPTPYVYLQDDDCIVDRARGLADLHEPGRITANMPVSRWLDYPDSCLVGWGAIVDVSLVTPALVRWAEGHPLASGEFLRDCDVVMTTLIPHEKVDLGFRHLPWAETGGRLFREPAHAAARAAMLEEARRVRDARRAA